VEFTDVLFSDMGCHEQVQCDVELSVSVSHIQRLTGDERSVRGYIFKHDTSSTFVEGLKNPTNKTFVEFTVIKK
jgi:hypothetical protein